MFENNVIQKIKNLKSLGIHESVSVFGKVTQVIGTVIEVSLPDVPLGSIVRIFNEKSGVSIEAEVVGFKKDRILVIPFSETAGVCANALVEVIEKDPKVCVGQHLIGSIYDGFLRPYFGEAKKPDSHAQLCKIHKESINPMARKRITKTLDLGVKALNGLLTFAEGQRVGIMAGSGVGKSVLMGMMSRYASADVNVIALIGERGREVREFIEENLGEEGLRKSVVIVSTGDQSPLARMRSALTATTIAEYFRDKGKKVLFMMDSLTRVAMAQREIGLAIGEPPTTKGYTPSVFGMLPRLLERAGNSDSEGSITAIYTVLVDGDDFSDPICDAARSILDGHINLSRSLAAANHFPAIEVLTSASRVMYDVVSQKHYRAANRLKEWMAIYQKNEDLINIGAYQPGSNPQLDVAIDMYPRINQFLKQDRSTSTDLDSTLAQLLELVGDE
jgi:flagellum-specific ATP synthase